MPGFKTDAMQALVDQSPSAVAAHDKPSWLALFAANYTVEDPVGSSPVCPVQENALAPLARFYDTFIAPNSIRFEVLQDYYGPDCVLRDLSIHITMAPKVCVAVPMHLLYRITEENGTLKIAVLAAHWELIPMVLRLAKIGFPALSVMFSLSRRMSGNLGMAGMLGFSKAALTPRNKRYRQLDALVTALNCQDNQAIKACFAGNYVAISDQQGRPLPLAALQGLTVSKQIAAGRMISATLRTATGNCVLLAETCQASGKLLSCTIFQPS